MSGDIPDHGIELTLEELDRDGALQEGIAAVYGDSRADFLRKAAIGGGTLLATLAAAYAESRNFARAVAVAEEAMNEARSLRDTDSIKLSENILASVRANVPYRNEPEQ